MPTQIGFGEIGAVQPPAKVAEIVVDELPCRVPTPLASIVSAEVLLDVQDTVFGAPWIEYVPEEQNGSGPAMAGGV